MGPKGVEPSPNGLNVRHAASYTTAPIFSPDIQSRLCVSNELAFRTSPFTLQTSKVVAPRIELSATRVSGGFGRPALDYRLCFQKSDTSESNREPPGPKPGVLPSAPVSDVVCRFRCGRFRRRISSLSVGREALESSSAVLQTAARPSQLPAHIGCVVGVVRSVGTRKKARCLR